jgi:hypothetical protein
VALSNQMNSGHENKGMRDLCDNSRTSGETSKVNIFNSHVGLLQPSGIFHHVPEYVFM